MSGFARAGVTFDGADFSARREPVTRAFDAAIGRIAAPGMNRHCHAATNSELANGHF